jgi:hypothetical protein
MKNHVELQVGKFSAELVEYIYSWLERIAKESISPPDGAALIEWFELDDDASDKIQNELKTLSPGILFAQLVNLYKLLESSV